MLINTWHSVYDFFFGALLLTKNKTWNYKTTLTIPCPTGKQHMENGWGKHYSDFPVPEAFPLVSTGGARLHQHELRGLRVQRRQERVVGGGGGGMAVGAVVAHGAGAGGGRGGTGRCARLSVCFNRYSNSHCLPNDRYPNVAPQPQAARQHQDEILSLRHPQ